MFNSKFWILLSIGFFFEVGSYGENRCQIPEVFPYPTVSYTGFDGNRENNQRIACDIATKYTPSYLALEGNMMYQPITFSADGKKLYATAMKVGSCNVFEVTLATGASKCLGQHNASVGFVNLEVDREGNTYYEAADENSTPESQKTKVISLNGAGQKRWETVLNQPIGPGAHFTPDGYLVFQSSAGIVNLLSRTDGKLVAAPFDIPKYLALTPVVSEEAETSTIQEKLADYILTNFAYAVGEVDEDGFAAGAGASTGASSFAGNTIGVTKNNQLMIAINSAQGGFLVALSVKKDSLGKPYLAYAWKVKMQGTGSATTPSISPNGRYVTVGDTEKGIYRIDIDACNRSPLNCTYEWRYELAADLFGNAAIDENGRIYTWNQSPSSSAEDFLAIDTRTDFLGRPKPVVAFSRSFPGMTMWTSSITVYNNIILGSYTTFSTSGLSHTMVGLNRYNGSTVFSYPLEDDVINNIAVGPDGAIYVPILGMVDLIAIPGDQGWKGGIKRFAPVF